MTARAQRGRTDSWDTRRRSGGGGWGRWGLRDVSQRRGDRCRKRFVHAIARLRRWSPWRRSAFTHGDVHPLRTSADARISSTEIKRRPHGGCSWLRATCGCAISPPRRCVQMQRGGRGAQRVGSQHLLNQPAAGQWHRRPLPPQRFRLQRGVVGSDRSGGVRARPQLRVHLPQFQGPRAGVRFASLPTRHVRQRRRHLRRAHAEIAKRNSEVVPRFDAPSSKRRNTARFL